MSDARTWCHSSHPLRGCLLGTSKQEDTRGGDNLGKADASTHSLSKHLQGSHVKSTVNVYQSNPSLGKIQRRIHNLSNTDVSPPSSTYPGVREKQDTCVSLCSPGTSLLGESQASNFVRGSVSQYNLVSLLDTPIKMHIFNKHLYSTFYMPGIILSVYKPA